MIPPDITALRIVAGVALQTVWLFLVCIFVSRYIVWE